MVVIVGGVAGVTQTNLFISEVTTTPSDPTVGTSMTFEATVANPTTNEFTVVTLQNVGFVVAAFLIGLVASVSAASPPRGRPPTSVPSTRCVTDESTRSATDDPTQVASILRRCSPHVIGLRHAEVVGRQ